ncbi:MAG: SAF domain-containing protein [Anaerolineales bacterium]|jgi:pilus assembly protein CpaB
MRRGRILILLAFVLILGAVAVYLVMNRLGDTGDETPAGTTPEPIGDLGLIVTAAREIPRGSIIVEEDLALSPYPVELIDENMITDVSLVVGKIARMDLVQGVTISPDMITDLIGDLVLGGSEAALAIPPGYTAMAIPMTRLSGVAYALRAGDAIDVLISLLIINLDEGFQTALPNLTGALASAGTPPVYLTASVYPEMAELGRIETEPVTGQLIYVLPQGIQRPRLVTQRLIENATVLHVGTFPLETEAAAPEAPEGVGAPAEPADQEVVASPKPPDIITLIVTPQDALALNWALKARADLMLTLRGPGDELLTDTTSVTFQYLLENYRITIPTSLPYGPEPAILLPTNPNLQDPVQGE